MKRKKIWAYLDGAKLLIFGALVTRLLEKQQMKTWEVTFKEIMI